MSEPEVQKILSDDGTLPQISPPPEEMKKFVASEIVRWGEVVTKAGHRGESVGQCCRIRLMRARAHRALGMRHGLDSGSRLRTRPDDEAAQRTPTESSSPASDRA